MTWYETLRNADFEGCGVPCDYGPNMLYPLLTVCQRWLQNFIFFNYHLFFK